jgi:predicted DCC family thiol-disulfide oxidoreductase YuxK
MLQSVNKSDRFDSIVLIERHRVFEKSDAVLRIAARLGYPWNLLRFFRCIPRRLRDAVYDSIAHNRYNWFGKRDSCRVPSPDLAPRFLQKGDVSSTDT